MRIRINPTDKKSVSDANQKISAYRLSLDEKKRKILDTLAKDGVDVAKMNLAGYVQGGTGNLASSIEAYYSSENGVALIKAGASYAAYVEYGTGVIGKENPHPNADGWVYDINGHGYKGWVYFDESRMHDGGSPYVRTLGSPASPFMYETLKWMEETCAEVAMEVFGHD